MISCIALAIALVFSSLPPPKYQLGPGWYLGQKVKVKP